MGVITNGEGFHGNSMPNLMSSLKTKWRIAMDTIMQGGRAITLHLPPLKSACVGSCRYNSTYKKHMSATGGICGACKGEGFMLEQRQTSYTANIRHEEMKLESADSGGQDTPAGRISQRVLITKTVIASYVHLQKCIGATIDGENYKLIGDLEKRAFGGTVYYVQATWRKMDK